MDFSQDTSAKNFSRGKLKVFYKGETADHRYFSETFSKDLIQSLPYTPVVSYYDEEKDDFVGHATEQQILGIVDPCAEVNFEKDDDGTDWCVCDVVLYTERPDKVGEIAKKIVGHPQSLELDPKSTKYVINYDEKKHFKNIEFTAGRFVGVSVLGKDQKPAFTGSSFFSYNEQFESKMKLLKDYCEGKNIAKDGDNMGSTNDFLKLSWGDISQKVGKEIAKQYENDACIYIVDMFSDSAIVRFFYYVEECEKLMRVKYSLDENQNVVIGDVSEVHVSYEDVEVKSVDVPASAEMSEIDTQKVDSGASDSDANIEDASVNDAAKPSEDEIPEEDKKKEDEPDQDQCESKEKKSESECSSTSEEEKKVAENCEKVEEVNITEDTFAKQPQEASAAPVEDVQITPEENQPLAESEKEVSVENVNAYNTDVEKDTSTSSTSFAESERAELEALKREKKVALVNSYKDTISEEDFNSFSEKIDSFATENDLELELLKAYKRYQDETAMKPMRAFAFAPKTNNATSETSLDSFVRKNMRK